MSKNYFYKSFTGIFVFIFIFSFVNLQTVNAYSFLDYFFNSQNLNSNNQNGQINNSDQSAFTSVVAKILILTGFANIKTQQIQVITQNPIPVKTVGFNEDMARKNPICNSSNQLYFDQPTCNNLIAQGKQLDSSQVSTNVIPKIISNQSETSLNNQTLCQINDNGNIYSFKTQVECDNKMAEIFKKNNLTFGGDSTGYLEDNTLPGVTYSSFSQPNQNNGLGQQSTQQNDPFPSSAANNSISGVCVGMEESSEVGPTKKLGKDILEIAGITKCRITPSSMFRSHTKQQSIIDRGGGPRTGVGSKNGSQHTKGRAADLRLSCSQEQKVQVVLNFLSRCYSMGGYGENGHIHFDHRPTTDPPGGWSTWNQGEYPSYVNTAFKKMGTTPSAMKNRPQEEVSAKAKAALGGAQNFPSVNTPTS